MLTIDLVAFCVIVFLIVLIVTLIATFHAIGQEMKILDTEIKLIYRDLKELKSDIHERLLATEKMLKRDDSLLMRCCKCYAEFRIEGSELSEDFTGTIYCDKCNRDEQ